MIRHVAVIDIGKTNAKVALVDLANMREVALRRIANAASADGPYPHHDVEALWAFILDSLAAIHREQRTDAISITTHGATAVLIDAEVGLALPVLDYEFAGPDALAADYDAIRPPFHERAGPVNWSVVLRTAPRRIQAPWRRLRRTPRTPQASIRTLCGLFRNPVQVGIRLSRALSISVSTFHVAVCGQP